MYGYQHSADSSAGAGDRASAEYVIVSRSPRAPAVRRCPHPGKRRAAAVAGRPPPLNRPRARAPAALLEALTLTPSRRPIQRTQRVDLGSGGARN
jgi:hypothetical protein